MVHGPPLFSTGRAVRAARVTSQTARANAVTGTDCPASGSDGQMMMGGSVAGAAGARGGGGPGHEPEFDGQRVTSPP